MPNVCRNSLQRITPIVASMSWRALRRFDVLPKVDQSCIELPMDPAYRARKSGRSHATAHERTLTMLAVLAVLLVLLAGLWNMMRGTSPNLSQTLMRWRVGLQFLAIVMTMILRVLCALVRGELDRGRLPATLLMSACPQGEQDTHHGRPQQDLHAHRRCRPHRARHRRARAQALRAHHGLRHGGRDQRRPRRGAPPPRATSTPTSTPCSGASRTTCSISAPT